MTKKRKGTDIGPGAESTSTVEDGVIGCGSGPKNLIESHNVVSSSSSSFFEAFEEELGSPSNSLVPRAIKSRRTGSLTPSLSSSIPNFSSGHRHKHAAGAGSSSKRTPSRDGGVTRGGRLPADYSPWPALDEAEYSNLSVSSSTSSSSNSSSSSGRSTSRCLLPADDLINNLPDVLIGQIFFDGFLPSHTIFQTLELVSKRIRSVASATMTKVDLCGLRIDGDGLQSLVRRHKSLTRIDLSYCPLIKNQDLRVLGSLGRSLRHLSLKGTEVASDTVEFLAEKLPKLLELDLGKTKPSQTHLVSDTAIKSIAANCRDLSVLGLSWNKSLTDEGVNSIASLRKLESLDLELCTGVTSAGLFALASPSTLEKLDLSGNPSVDDDVVNKVKGNLVTIVLRHTSVTPSTLDSLIDLPTLKAVDVSHSDHISTLAVKERISDYRSKGKLLLHSRPDIVSAPVRF